MQHNISEALHGLMLSYRKALKYLATEGGISIPVTHIRALKCITNIENCSARDITQRLRLDKSQVARLVRDLLEQDYIEKDKHPTNNRCQVISLTAAGKGLQKKLPILKTKHAPKCAVA
ncbi:MarR family winged helix-turn-helix transcriptional regulator [Marinomonas posidonica]|uniref:MarR family winged helix-turn-helix transcriptional regulator n=1 Tax=Marinomonas posidonica TaxID=936476 RepID=UPI00373664FA